MQDFIQQYFLVHEVWDKDIGIKIQLFDPPNSSIFFRLSIQKIKTWMFVKYESERQNEQATFWIDFQKSPSYKFCFNWT